MINTTLTNSNGQTAKVLREEDLGDGKKLLHLATSNLDAWDVGAAFTSDAGEGTVESVVQSEIASIYEARTEQQVLDEDEPGEWLFGWKFNELGWAVDFVEGKSLYGDLVALNQNRQNIGVQGPTSTEGTGGSALSVSQNNEIANEVAQVNGWKQSSSRTSYTITPSPLVYTDDEFIYADAFISWDGDGNITQNTSTLEQRPANHTIEVEFGGDD